MNRRKKPSECHNIIEIRHEIDKIDNELIGLFAVRNEFIKEIVQYKTDEDEVVALSRKNFVIEERGKLAEKFGLDPNLFKKIFTLLVEDNIRKELNLFNLKKQESNIKSK